MMEVVWKNDPIFPLRSPTESAPATSPFTIECKLLDKATDKTFYLYCKEGVKRFVDGEYAWARREAAMLAYVRDGSRVVPDLSTYLERNAAKDDDPYHT